MSQELLVNVTPQETRVAVLDNGSLQEVHIERTRSRGLVGNIYQGQVSRVLPGMQAAFIDAGLQRTAFLHASDLRARYAAATGEGGDPPPIQQLLREQQKLMVQVVKDPIGSKGARLTTQIAIPARTMVLIAGNPGIGVSARIEAETERERLRSLAQTITAATPEDGCILRTAAEGADQAALQRDWDFLQRLWADIRRRAEHAQPATLLHEDLPLVLRILRDLVGEEVERVRVDSREWHERMIDFSEAFLPDAGSRLEHYPGERPIFDLYGVEDEIQRALQRRVQLKSGGYLIIDQTEALTTIDVNTGGYVGHRTLEETIFKTNLEAAQTIVRQLRLRNLGGIIIVDFIDMEDAEHQRQVLRALSKGLERDHARTQVSAISSLGLVEITRKRIRESLQHQLCEVCPTCAGRGYLKSAETVCHEVTREILREARQFEFSRLLVLAAQEVVDRALEEEGDGFAELEAFIGKPIEFQAEPLYNPEQFDVVLM
ncbi:ribonuclease G [Spiribacter pallidus]|uniref:ribonuclease G n=1 Tax=Spiribacter pallidus TaxID=1987936 RepID=UPI00349FCA8E